MCKSSVRYHQGFIEKCIWPAGVSWQFSVSAVTGFPLVYQRFWKDLFQEIALILPTRYSSVANAVVSDNIWNANVVLFAYVDWLIFLDFYSQLNTFVFFSLYVLDEDRSFLEVASIFHLFKESLDHIPPGLQHHLLKRVIILLLL